MKDTTPMIKTPQQLDKAKMAMNFLRNVTLPKVEP